MNNIIAFSELQTLYNVADNPSLLLTQDERTIQNLDTLKTRITQKVSDFVLKNTSIYLAIEDKNEKEKMIRALNQLFNACPTSQKMLGLIQQLKGPKHSDKKDERLLGQPDEIWLKILYYAIEKGSDFNRMNLVNRKFHKLVKHQEIIEKLFDRPMADLTRSGKKAVKFLISAVDQNKELQKFPFKLDFSWREDLDDNDLALLAKTFKNLHTISLHLCPKITSAGISSLAKECVNLQDITYPCEEVSLAALSMHCQNLKRITIPHLKNRNFVDLKDLTSLEQLESITLPSNNTNFNDVVKSGKWPQLKSVKRSNGGSDLDAQALLALVKASPKIRSLYSSPYSEEEFNSLLPHLSNLESIVLPSSKLSEDTARALAKSCPKLKKIALPTEYWRFPGKAFISAFMQVCPPTLQFLNLIEADDNMLITLSNRCPNLKMIHLKSSECSDLGIQSLAENCLGLEKISVSEDNEKKDSQITVKAIEVLQHYTNLNEITFDVKSFFLSWQKASKVSPMQRIIFKDQQQEVDEDEEDVW